MNLNNFNNMYFEIEKVENDIILIQKSNSKRYYLSNNKLYNIIDLGNMYYIDHSKSIIVN